MCVVLVKHAGMVTGQIPELVETATAPAVDEEYDNDLPELVEAGEPEQKDDSDSSDDMLIEEETEEEMSTSVM